MTASWPDPPASPSSTETTVGAGAVGAGRQASVGQVGPPHLVQVKRVAGHGASLDRSRVMAHQALAPGSSDHVGVQVARSPGLAGRQGVLVQGGGDLHGLPEIILLGGHGGASLAAAHRAVSSLRRLTVRESKDARWFLGGGSWNWTDLPSLPSSMDALCKRYSVERRQNRRRMPLRVPPKSGQRTRLEGRTSVDLLFSAKF